MTKSEYIRARIQPLIRMMKNFVHQEERDSMAIKVEIWALRLIADIEQLGPMDMADLDTKDIPYQEDL